jgi:hypothetical protein
MRIPNPLTISVVWLATVLVAFALGRSLQLATQSNDGEAAPAVAGAQSMDTMQDAAGTAHSDTTSDGEVPADSLGGASDSTRTLAQLAAAFSKPTSDPKRAASIRELLIHLAEAQPGDRSDASDADRFPARSATCSAEHPRSLGCE